MTNSITHSEVLNWFDASGYDSDCGAVELAAAMILDGRDGAWVSGLAATLTADEILEAGEIETAFWVGRSQ